MLSNFTPFALASMALIAMGCVGASPPPAKPPVTSLPAPEASSPTRAAAPASSPTASNVSISDGIRTKCGIPDSDAYFPFDSARLTSKDHTPLDSVARCFVSGPLKGRPLKLIGHADPRGEADYNMTLGLSRADSVGQYLTARGMDRGKTKTTSRGSMDATGTDESTWQNDRRVDVMLGD
jgi:peptidoglycan-associated lipoprotein